MLSMSPDFVNHIRRLRLLGFNAVRLPFSMKASSPLLLSMRDPCCHSVPRQDATGACNKPAAAVLGPCRAAKRAADACRCSSARSRPRTTRSRARCSRRTTATRAGPTSCGPSRTRACSCDQVRRPHFDHCACLHLVFGESNVNGRHALCQPGWQCMITPCSTIHKRKGQ